MKGPLPLIFAIVLACGNSYSQAPTRPAESSIPNVDYCELIRNPALYDQKVIRVQATFVRGGPGTSQFYDFRCDHNNSTWVEFDDFYESRTKPEYVRTLARMERESGPRWGRPHVTVIVLTFKRAEVVFVGKFASALPARVGNEVDFPVLTRASTDPNLPDEWFSTLKSDYAHQGEYKYLFMVQRVERVKAIDPKAPW